MDKNAPTTSVPATGSSTTNPYGSTNWPISNQDLQQRDTVADLVKQTSTSSIDNLINCQLIDYFNNITSILKTDEQRQTWKSWVKDIQKSIISNLNFTNIQKVANVSFVLNKFLNVNDDLKQQLFYENLGSWGSVKDMILVGYDIQIVKTKKITQLDSQNSSTLISVIQKTFKNDVKNSAIIQQLTSNIVKSIQASTTYVQQQSKTYKVIKSFFEEQQDTDLQTTINNIQIDDYGTFEYFFDCITWVSFFSIF